MNIPDAWPPNPDDDSSASDPLLLVPMFPLPNIYLFPGSVMPLNIFEPRYRKMVEDQLDRQGRIVMANLVQQESPEGKDAVEEDLVPVPPVHPIAGLGEIGHHKRLDDGRFLIWLIGLARVRVKEVASSEPYRIAEVEVISEVPPSDDEAEAIRPRLLDAIGKRTTNEMANAGIPLGLMVDALLQCLPLTPETMQDMFSELSISQRAELALIEHNKHPLPEPRDL